MKNQRLQRTSNHFFSSKPFVPLSQIVALTKMGSQGTPVQHRHPPSYLSVIRTDPVLLTANLSSHLCH
jgi:hypothetical protein